MIGGEAGPELVVGRDFNVIPLAAGGASAQNGQLTTGVTDPLANIGNPFSFETFSPGQVAATPTVQALLGNRRQPAFAGTSLDLSLPGTNARLPFLLNLARYSRALPSEQQFVQSVYETPRALGGLGLDFSDVLAASQRAAPVGSGYQLLTQYGD